MKRTYWKIECEEGMKKLSSTIVKSGQISEENIVEFIKILFAKYILNDNEILENLCRKNTKRYNKLSLYERFSEKDANNLLRIGYLAQSSNITITATLLYENELSSDEIAYTDR